MPACTERNTGQSLGLKRPDQKMVAGDRIRQSVYSVPLLK